MPHQQRIFALAVLRQEELHVHLLDHVLAVRVELGERAARLALDLAHLLAAHFRDAPADMKRAHAAQHDVVVGESRQRNEPQRECEQRTHPSPPSILLT